MSDYFLKTRKSNKGFSLAEVLAALTIGSMILVTILGLYNRVENITGSLNRKIISFQLPNEILQRIAEDLDRIIAPISDSKVEDTKITIKNKSDHLYPSAQLKIERSYYDTKNKKQLFEEIVWQTNYDYDVNGLTLYRSYRGIAVEDKLLDEEKEDWERELFIPLSSGVTFFEVKIPGKDTDTFLDSWSSGTLPHGIVVTISFAEPFKQLDGTLNVLDEEKITRTIAIDRTRKIKFDFVAPEFDGNEPEMDINEPDMNMNEPNIPRR